MPLWNIFVCNRQHQNIYILFYIIPFSDSRAGENCVRCDIFEYILQDWPRQWCYQQQKTDLSDAELNWMLTLWAYRDPEVNYVYVYERSGKYVLSNIRLAFYLI